MKRIVLASASARRARILLDCGIDHDIVISGIEEIMDKKQHVSEIVKVNAEKKAEEVKGKCLNSIIISADTLVAHETDIIGKPTDADEARFILEKFSGSTVEVYTGMCVLDVDNDRKIVDVDKSIIYVDTINFDNIEHLFSLLGPYDKAGGFSIEGVGSMLFDNIEGSYFNILGLSMMKLKKMFDEIGLNLLDYIKN